MATLQDLIAQKEALDREIERAQGQARTEALETIRTLMEETGLTVEDLAGKGRAAAKPRANAGQKVAAKYRNKQSGETWSGRGLQPKWLKAALKDGAKIEDFAV